MAEKEKVSEFVGLAAGKTPENWMHPLKDIWALAVQDPSDGHTQSECDAHSSDPFVFLHQRAKPGKHAEVNVEAGASLADKAKLFGSFAKVGFVKSVKSQKSSMVNPNVFGEDGQFIFLTPREVAITLVMAAEPWSLEAGESVTQKFTGAADLFNSMGKTNRAGVLMGDGTGR